MTIHGAAEAHHAPDYTNHLSPLFYWMASYECLIATSIPFSLIPTTHYVLYVHIHLFD